MCSFGSCKTRFKFLSQFRKVRNAFECFVTQVQTRLPKTKCVWPMKINVICTVQSTHIAACSGALDDNLPIMSAEIFPRLTGGIRSALDETDQNPEETGTD